MSWGDKKSDICNGLIVVGIYVGGMAAQFYILKECGPFFAFIVFVIAVFIKNLHDDAKSLRAKVAYLEDRIDSLEYAASVQSKKYENDNNCQTQDEAK